MQVKYLIIVMADDSVMLTEFILNDGHGFSQPLTDESVRANIAKLLLPQGKRPVKSWREVEPEAFYQLRYVPDNRAYRNALRDNAGVLTYDMPHARELHRSELRNARAPLLAALDIEYNIADEQNSKLNKQRIANDRQRLRDITADPRIESAQTIDQLKLITP